MLHTETYIKSRDSERKRLKKNEQKYIEAGVAILFPDKIEIRSK